MTTFVLVPGAWHGGWWFEPLVAALADHGHRGVAVTLAGLGADDDLTRDVVTLDTHVAQLLATVRDLTSDGSQVVLVGHSYGGMVTTAVADAVPAGVAALVHLDADLPADGDSTWSLAPPEMRAEFIASCAATGVALDPLPFFDDRARPHPLATFVQTVHLTGAFGAVPRKRYVACLDTPGGLQAPVSMDRARHAPDWEYEEWHTTHDVLRDGPERVLQLLLRP